MNNLNDPPNWNILPNRREPGDEGSRWNYALLVPMLGLAAFRKYSPGERAWPCLGGAPASHGEGCTALQCCTVGPRLGIAFDLIVYNVINSKHCS